MKLLLQAWTNSDCCVSLHASRDLDSQDWDLIEELIRIGRRAADRRSLPTPPTPKETSKGLPVEELPSTPEKGSADPRPCEVCEGRGTMPNLAGLKAFEGHWCEVCCGTGRSGPCEKCGNPRHFLSCATRGLALTEPATKAEGSTSTDLGSFDLRGNPVELHIQGYPKPITLPAEPSDQVGGNSSVEECECCGAVATKKDVEGVPLCDGCYEDLKRETNAILSPDVGVGEQEPQ